MKAKNRRKWRVKAAKSVSISNSGAIKTSALCALHLVAKMASKAGVSGETNNGAAAYRKKERKWHGIMAAAAWHQQRGGSISSVMSWHEKRGIRA